MNDKAVVVEIRARGEVATVGPNDETVAAIQARSEIAAIRARSEAATAGPWQWTGNAKSKTCRLTTCHSGRRIVMDLWRWGMTNAQPRFQVTLSGEAGEGIMVKLAELGASVGPRFRNAERHEFCGIAHPDAEFIAHARHDVTFLLERLDEMREQRDTAMNAAFEGNVKLNEMVVNSEGFYLSVTHAGGALLAQHFASVLLDCEIENYLSLQFLHPEAGEILVTIHRPGGKTPHQLRQAAEQKATNLQQQVEALKQQMTRECKERDAEIDRLRSEQRELFSVIGDVLEPGQGVSPAVVSAAIDDVKEIGHERDEARRSAGSSTPEANLACSGTGTVIAWMTPPIICPDCGGKSWGGGTDSRPRPWCNTCGADQPGWEPRYWVRCAYAVQVQVIGVAQLHKVCDGMHSCGGPDE